ncbi:NUDIX domain-containing protein [Candidatus Woesearchaeota archaeon]|nr:NUDIX domain-containing protein [Candidatus Woesearchaeota archaeon]
MRLRSIRDVLAEYPAYRVEWGFHGDVESQGHGCISHVVICTDSGKPLYDKYMIAENPGVIVVPYDVKSKLIRVGLIMEERVIPGKEFLSVPRGSSEGNENLEETALRELLEETGLKAESIELISYLNPNPAVYRTRTPVMAARITDLGFAGKASGDGFAESIMRVKAYTLGELRLLRLECGITKAALFDFESFCPVIQSRI